MTPKSQIPVHPKLAELLPKLDALEKALLAGDEKFPTHLKEIHTYLIQYEELAHLLTEDQIKTILNGHQRKLGIILANETTKKKGSNAPKAKPGESVSEQL